MTTDIRKILFLLVFVPGVLVTCQDSGDGPTPPAGKVIAFPGADGGGRYTTGGQGGNIYVVNSLEDDVVDPKIGTLRYGIQTTGKRIIVFNVAGRIDLKGDLSIRSGSVTILGQSAPGDGICISGYPILVRANNVIIRFLRFRMGDLNGREADALTIEKGHSNIIIDHCSCSWSTDECLSIYGVENASVQYCIVSESLNNSVHAKGAHGYAGIWGGKNTSFHHNLLAHHSSRMPRFDHDYVTDANVAPTDFINNVVYNWGGNSAYGGESSSTTGNQRQYNFIANYYKPGKATKSGVKARLLNPTTKCNPTEKDPHAGCTGKYGGSVVPGKFYIINNIMYGSDAVTQDNWSGVYPDESSKKDQCRSDKRFTFENALTGEQTAQQAYDAVLAKVGCSLVRDAVDTRVINEVKNGNYTYKGSNGSTGGLIDTPDDVGGWPDYVGTKDFSLDIDKDGIPNEWEIAHGLNPEDPKDARATTLSKPYLNLEVYLNDIVAHLY